jgi:hypothetical protein
MAPNPPNQGIDANRQSKPYWIDPFPTQERTDPAIAPMLAAVARIPEVVVQAMVDQSIAARRAALGW